MKYYAVKKGRKTGIFTTWPEAEKKVKGFSGAQYKSFKTEAEAKAYLGGQKNSTSPLKSHKSHKQHKSHPKSKIKNDAADYRGEVVVYTDGGSRNHGNVRGGHVKASDKAAWAFLIKEGNQKHSKSGGEFGATNNRMEIMALFEALKYLRSKDMQDDQIDVIMDSKYVLDAIQKGWLAGWRRRGWTRAGGSKLQNKQLWQSVDTNLSHFPRIQYYWTKGHADDEGNIFVDHLLNKTMDKMGKKSPQPTGTHQPINQPANKPSHTKDRAPIKKSKQGPRTSTSVSDIEESLKQLGLFDDDND